MLPLHRHEYDTWLGAEIPHDVRVAKKKKVSCWEWKLSPSPTQIKFLESRPLSFEESF